MMIGRHTSRLVCITFMILLAQACTIEGSLRGLVGYYKKTKALRPDLFQTNGGNSSSYCNSGSYEKAKIPVINGKQLLECLSNNSQAVIYIWSPHCKSEICYPLHVFQEQLDKKDIELYVVAEYYDSERMAREYTISRPILVINVKHYKTNLTSRYKAKFLFDITEGKLKKTYHRLIVFKEGKFSHTVRDLFEL